MIRIEKTVHRYGEKVDMSIMWQGGCYKCGRMCSTGIDGSVTLDDIPTICCANCYSKHHTKKAILNRKLKKIKKIRKKFFWERYFNYFCK